MLARGTSSRAGPWRAWPFQVEILDSIHDPNCSGLVIQFPSQCLGKSELVNNVIGHSIDCDSGGILMTLPNWSSAENWSRTKLAPMLSSTVTIRDLIRTTQSKKDSGGTTILLKTWATGFLAIAGANSPSGLAMFSCRLCCFDEIDRFPRSIPGSSEGDPIAVGLRRSETFADAFSIMTSSPTERGVSRIEYEYSLTDQRKWFVACPACSHEFVMLWHHVVWDKGPAGEHLARTARIECPECHSRHDDAARAEMVRRGRWIATGLEFRRRRRLLG